MPVDAAVPPSSIFGGVVPPSSRPVPPVPPCPPFQAHCSTARGKPKGGNTGALNGAGVNNGQEGGTRGDTPYADLIDFEPVKGGRREIARIYAVIDAMNVHPTYIKLFGPHRPISSLTDAELEAERVAVFARLEATRKARAERGRGRMAA